MKNFLAYSQELHGSVKISYSFSVDSAIWNALLFGYSRAHFPFFFFFPSGSTICVMCLLHVCQREFPDFLPVLATCSRLVFRPALISAGISAQSRSPHGSSAALGGLLPAPQPLRSLLLCLLPFPLLSLHTCRTTGQRCPPSFPLLQTHQGQSRATQVHF